MNTDRISIPVGIDLTAADKAIKDLAIKLEAELSKIIPSAAKAGFRPTITGQEQFEAGGRRFEVKGRAFQRSEAKDIGGEGGEENIQALTGFEATIREIRQRLSKSIQLDVQRLSEFKNSLKFQPLEVRREAFRDFLQQQKNLQDSLNNLLPSDQIEKVRNFIRTSTTISSNLRSKFETELNEFQQSIANLSSDEQTDNIRDFVSRFGDINNEIGARLTTASRSIQKQKFTALKTKISGMDPGNAIQAVNRYKQDIDALVTDADALIRSLREKFKGQTLGQKRKRYSEVRLGNEGREIEVQITAIEDYLRDGGQMIKQANADLRKLRSQLGRKQFTQQRQEIGQLKLEDQEQAWNSWLQNNQQFKKQVEFEINKVRGQVKRKDFRALFQNTNLPLDQRADAFEKYAASGQEFAELAREQARRLRRTIDRQAFEKLRVDTFQQPLQARIAAFDALANSNNQFARQISNFASTLRKQLQSQQQSNLGIDITGLSPVQQLQRLRQALVSGEGFKEKIQAQVRVLERQVAQQEFREIKGHTDLPIQDRIDLYNNYIKGGGRFAQQARQEIVKLNQKLSNQQFRDFKLQIEPLNLQDKLTQIQQYLQQPNARIQEANNLYTRYTQQLNRQQFSELKIQNTGRTLEDQIRAVQAFAQANAGMQNEANALIRRLTQQWVQQTQRTRRSRFTDWLKQLQTADPIQAIQQLDTYIANPLSRFVEDAKLLRQRIQRMTTGQQQAGQRERNRNFANNVLIGASAGIGMLGQAGFPLLNIGFAAMSGGPVGAAIAAFSTAIGETARHLNALSQSTQQAARDINFIPKSLKIVEAQMKGFEAFVGVGALSARQAQLQQQLNDLRNLGPAALSANSIWSNIGGAIKGMLPSEVGRASSQSGFKTYLESIAVIPYIQRTFARGFDLQRETNKNLLPNVESAYKSAVAEMSKSVVGIENDPYQSWLRMQQAAMDPTKQMEMEIQRAILSTLKEQLDYLKYGIKPKSQNAQPQGLARGFWPNFFDPLSTLMGAF